MTGQPRNQGTKQSGMIARLGFAAVLLWASAHPTIAYAEQQVSAPPSMPTVAPESVAVGRDIAMAVLNVNERARITSAALNSTMEMAKHNVVEKLTTAEERKNNPAIEKAVHNFMYETIQNAQNDMRAAMPGLPDAYAQAYARHFSLAELTQIRTFVTSRTGEKFILLGTHIGQEREVSEWYRALSAKSKARETAAIEKLTTELAAARSTTTNRK